LLASAPFGRAHEKARPRGAASAGNLGETFRGNRGFRLTREAPRPGRGHAKPEGADDGDGDKRNTGTGLHQPQRPEQA